MLEGCSFCKEKKFYPMRYHAKGQQTMATMLMNLFGTQHDEDCVDEPDGSGVRLFPITDDGYFLEYDNMNLINFVDIRSRLSKSILRG